MNLTAPTGGPDLLDSVIVQISTDGGSIYHKRLRISGAPTNECSWPYTATGMAKVYYLPQQIVSFQPTTTGLQTTQGYSTAENFISRYSNTGKVKVTVRSSSSGDTWLIDNAIVVGEVLSILPVTLTKFKGMRLNGKNVQLNWSTSLQLNVKRFEIEYAVNDLVFKG